MGVAGSRPSTGGDKYNGDLGELSRVMWQWGAIAGRPVFPPDARRSTNVNDLRPRGQEQFFKLSDDARVDGRTLWMHIARQADNEWLRERGEYPPSRSLAYHQSLARHAEPYLHLDLRPDPEARRKELAYRIRSQMLDPNRRGSVGSIKLPIEDVFWHGRPRVHTMATYMAPETMPMLPPNKF